MFSIRTSCLSQRFWVGKGHDDHDAPTRIHPPAPPWSRILDIHRFPGSSYFIMIYIFHNDL